MPNIFAYSPDYLFRTVIGVLGGHPSLSHCAKDLQDGPQIMALGNGPKQDCACLKISPLLLVDFVQFYLETWMHMRGVYPSHMEGQRSRGAALGRITDVCPLYAKISIKTLTGPLSLSLTNREHRTAALVFRLLYPLCSSLSIKIRFDRAATTRANEF